MHSFDKILIGIAFSPNLVANIYEAIRLSNMFEAELVCVHVGNKTPEKETKLQTIFDKAKIVNQFNLDKQIANSTDIISVKIHASELNIENVEVNSTFDAQLFSSDFITKQEIQNALLSLEDKELFLKRIKDLDSDSIKINHSQQLLEKDIIAHNSVTTFKESKEDAQLNILNYFKGTENGQKLSSNVTAL